MLQGKTEMPALVQLVGEGVLGRLMSRLCREACVCDVIIFASLHAVCIESLGRYAMGAGEHAICDNS
jgi:hypothetical protein